MSEYKDILPVVGLVYKAARLLNGVASINTYQYSDAFETRLFSKKKVIFDMEETGSSNGITVKIQGRMMYADGTYSDWVDLPPYSGATVEFTIAAGAKLIKTCSDSWAEFRVGYKSTVADSHGAITAYASVQ
jgi:archaeosine-15-forming tRNA-guanine transglycosylase